jgi:hypothetical protein
MLWVDAVIINDRPTPEGELDGMLTKRAAVTNFGGRLRVSWLRQHDDPRGLVVITTGEKPLSKP